jgi:hypothetical protein
MTARLDAQTHRRTGTALIACAVLVAARPARAQLSFTFSAGARYSTVLVHDQIVTPFAVRPALAPAFAVTAAMPLDRPWNASATLDLSTSEVRREDQNGATQPITHLTTAALGLGLSRSLKPWLDGSLRIGVLKYFPSQDLGLFQDGGPYFPFAQVAFDLRPPFASRYGLGLEVRADAHKFITDALLVEGFSESRPVARWAVAVTWTPGAPR